ncbi:DUF3467 domain-containing protein [Pontivivens ytuae]|uniref:DUF3467 domain-containing protein n=1 Tax=Pontivivens ytuae TaxID=2789856 RepID=A0A7S9QCR9_9RHOB|nr:DUF3467 domain-containing protein [Pontivivens ytuae]QPH54218.1 DUF3467 domain-containing protein [Pontivivens ytuae]
MAEQQAGQGKSVIFRDEKMRTSYANVANVASTREEISVLFGIGRSWHGKGEEYEVDLNDRVMLSPFTAKRLAAMLVNAVAQYEARHGKIDAGSQEGGEG